MADPRKFDPSGTGAIQRAFIKDLTQRFARLKRAVWRLVVDEDAFGIGDGKPLPVGPTLNTRWKFVTGPEKMKQFENWLDGQIKAGILSEDGSGNGDVTGARYIRSTYKQALVSTYRKVNKDTLQGSAGDFYEGTQNAFLKDTFESSEAASKMAMLGTRVYSSLKDITSTMDAKMSRILAQGLADGKSPRELGRQLASEVDGISKARGARIARTEIIHTHAEGQLDAFEALKVHDLVVMAEWLTTPDKKLCSRCAELEGIVLTVSEARGLLPRHPNCRCAWIPADVGESKKGQIRTKAGIEGAIERSVKEERPNAETKDAFKLSKWLGADIKVDTRPKSVDSLPMFAPAEGLWGQQPTAVMRWMGKEGWNAKDAQRVLKEMGVDAAEGTIKTQLGAGAKGLRGPAASLTDEQVAILRAKKAGDGIIKPPPITPPIKPPVIPPVTPPAVVPGELPPIPAINQPGTAVARWLGKEGFTFKEARKVLDEAGIKISDATLKTQLGAGAKGLRGAAATLTDAQVAAFRARRVIPPPGVQVAKTITKPVKLARVLPPPSPPVAAVKAEFEQITEKNVRERIANVKSLDDLVERIKKERGEYFDAFTVADKKLREAREKNALANTPETKREMVAATKEWQAAWNKRAGVLTEMRTKVHKMIALDKEDRINLTMNVAEKADAEFKEKTEAARSFLESITKKFQGGVMKSPSGGVRITQSKIENLSYRAEVIKGRAHYVSKGIHCETRDGLTTFVHEIAHGIEQDMPMMRNAAESFRLARISAAGTADIAMSEAAPGRGYDKHEKGNKDEFDKYFDNDSSHAYYVGKSYGQSATEIISMGTEALFHDPAGFAVKDPEYFKFIVGVLRGDLW